jgi:hypothetical protein
MKKTVLWLVLIALCVSPLVLAGCDGTVYSYEERMRRGRMIREYNFRQAVDDWDQFWLQDRNLRGSQWHPRVGL